jgi:hypothetical protein
MENRIKECQLDLSADRTLAATMRANQLRLWFASMAYVLLCTLRRIGLAHTQFAQATCGTIRLKLLKIGALVRRSVRRIKTPWPRPAHISTSSPWRMPYCAKLAPEKNQTARSPALRWSHLFGKFGGLDKLGSGFDHAANLCRSAIPIASLASFGVCPPRLE